MLNDDVDDVGKAIFNDNLLRLDVNDSSLSGIIYVYMYPDDVKPVNINGTEYYDFFIKGFLGR